ncbi:unnamed protein product [Paramecium sonneborni]|uniref:Uncharacterized protein n=1 Tax=Paramecium sonneborni TaxID=65129 RepID=A0A8S1NQB9_9CILI|nr:unnamed protein product [Paramecium sonneborni]
MKYLQLILIIGLTVALKTTDQSRILDPNDLMFQQKDISSSINIQEQSFETTDQQILVQEDVIQNSINEVMTEAELQHALITKDDLSDKPDIQMGTQNAFFLQKRKN